MVRKSTSQEILLEEWKEARTSLKRFDEYLLNLRRYGFTLATILIGADAYLSMTEGVSPWAKTGAAAAVMLLIFALFLLDQHVKALQRAALNRAARLERQLGMGTQSDHEQRQDAASRTLSELQQEIINSPQVTHGGTPIYFLFLIVTGSLGSVAVLTTKNGMELNKWGSLIAVALICLFLCVGSLLYNWRVRNTLANILVPKGVGRQLAGVFSRLGQTLQKKDKQT